MKGNVMVCLFQLSRCGVINDMNYPPAGLRDDAELVTVPQRMDILAEQERVLNTVRLRASFRPAVEEGHTIPTPPFGLGKRDDVRNLQRYVPACYPAGFVAISNALAARGADGEGPMVRDDVDHDGGRTPGHVKWSKERTTG